MKYPVKTKEEIIQGKSEGIKYLCKKHLYISNIKPCEKCLKELDLRGGDNR